MIQYSGFKQIIIVGISLQLHLKNNAKLLFTDTNSLVEEMEADKIDEDFYENKNLLDFSVYPQDSKSFDFVSKNVIGKMKDVFKGTLISEFVESNSKMYFLIAVDAGESKKAKGVNKNFVKNIMHKKYVDVLFNKITNK